MRLRRPDTKPVEPVPAELRLGCLVDLWDPVTLDFSEAWRQYLRARRRWLTDHGIPWRVYGIDRDVWPDELRHVNTFPWCWDEQPADHRARLLERCGLPPTWTPPRRQR